MLLESRIVQIGWLMDTALYQAVGTVEILEVAGVAQVTRICRLVGEGMQNIDEVKWRSVM